LSFMRTFCRKRLSDREPGARAHRTVG
jgi:hypothetical protein